MDLEKILGRGKLFYNGKESDESPFKIIIYPQQMIIQIEQIPIDAFGLKCKFKGITISNENIEADIIVTGVGDNELFVEKIFIGKEIINVTKSIFRIIGFYQNGFGFEIKGFKVSTLDEKNVKIEKKYYENWGIPRNGIKLVIEKLHQDRNDAFDLANDICTLLSIASGNDVVMNKQECDESFTILGKMKGSFYSFKNIIPYENIEQFLVQTLPTWLNLSDDDKKLIRNLVIYINSASDKKDYLDDRIFKIAQCWEMAANKWVNIEIELPKSLLELGTQLKSTCKTWRKEYPKEDESGFWTGRVLDSLNWAKAIDKLEKLVDQFNFDREKIQLDFSTLKDNVRDKVAHEGIMISFDDSNKLFEVTRFGIRLVILKKLGYTSRINDPLGEYLTVSEIDSYFK